LINKVSCLLFAESYELFLVSFQDRIGKSINQGFVLS
jgi:hypothetical protein